MSDHYLLSSVTRIAPLAHGFTVRPLPRERWQRGDYVVGEVTATPGLRQVELPCGRMAEVMAGDLVIGAWGRRMATLEAVGDWQAIGADGGFHLLTSGGLMGRLVSRSPYVRAPVSLVYRGHVHVDGRSLRMDDCLGPAPPAGFTIPVVLIVGTSMSAGKTTAGRIVIRQLKQAGLIVIGAKLTGAARYRDALSFQDAGADRIFDFVAMGLPSTVCPADLFKDRLQALLARIARCRADVLVAEAGASPLEPYNGLTAMELLGPQVRCTILCASDPYAVMGVATAFACQPDLIAGGAANTSAAIDLVKRLTGREALNLLDSRSLPRLRQILASCLEMELG